MRSQKQALEILLDTINHGKKLQHGQEMNSDFENLRIESFLFHAVRIVQNKDSKQYRMLNEHLKNLKAKTAKKA